MHLVARLNPSLRRPVFILLATVLILILSALVNVLVHRYSGPASSPLAGPPPAPVELSAESTIARLQGILRDNPENTYAYAQLGLALLQRMRETGDVALYAQADMAFAEALKRDPQHLDALVGQGILALTRHDFSGALRWAEQAQAINPYRAGIVGIKVDAFVELGRYEEAVAATQTMVDLRPDLSSYSRVSYLRELYGDTPGAIDAMQAAVDAGVPGTESWLWVQTQLGHLYFNSGDWRRAEGSYQEALRFRPDYVYALAGLGRVRAAQGQMDEAIELLTRVTNVMPLPEFVITLGDLYQASGQAERAAQQYQLVGAIEKLYEANGVDVDLEMALFSADHDQNLEATLARARKAWAARPSIHGADTLAWALYKVGAYDEAKSYSDQALKLGTKDALKLFHAGMIAYRLGQKDQARTYLEQALAINPYFSILYADEARETLEELQ
jgi:tetratricopeptide (TPR) repeat protein